MKSQELDAETRERLLGDLPKVYARVLARGVVFAKDPRVRAVVGGDTRTAAEELVQEAVVRTLRGERNWDPSRVPDLEHFLVQAVRSIADSCKKPGGRRADYSELAANPGNVASGPEDMVASKEEIEQLEASLFEAAGDDDELLVVVEGLLDGAEAPRDIAARRGWDMKKAEVVWRKLRRRMQKQSRDES